VRQQYQRQLQWRYPAETQVLDAVVLADTVYESLKLCGPLRVQDPKEVLRFLALIVLLTAAQKRSAFLLTVVYRVLLATDGWGARKRLNFIDKFVVGRPPHDSEPDFGVWFIADPRYCPAVTSGDLSRAIFVVLPRVDGAQSGARH
jgi:hypothetical protein